MQRKNFFQVPVKHMKIDRALTVDSLIQQFRNAGSFGAGRLSTACDVYEQMLRDKKCTIFLALAGITIKGTGL